MTTRTTTVSTAAQLVTVARAAKAGDTILLASGNFGDVVLSHINPVGAITIKSANPANDAVFRTLRIGNASNIILEDIDVNRPLKIGESSNGAAIQVNGAKNITLVGLDLSGSMDGNALNDGHGISIAGGRGISILDSTLQQLRTAVIVARSENFLFAGNTVTQVQEGVQIAGVNRGIFEQNYMSNWQANYAAGAHPDMFQVNSGGTNKASANLIFRDNVMLPGSDPVGGIFIRSEGVARGERHDNILIENNYYEGAYRHAITVANADDVTVRGNTVLMGNNKGLVPAINLNDLRGGLIENNISTMILESTTARNSGLVFRNNVDVWDEKTKKGVMASSLFETREAGDIDFRTLNVVATSSVASSGAGFKAVADIGQLSGSSAAQIAAWLPSLDQQFAVFL